MVASNRYPCDQTGNCGGNYSDDWPLLPNTPYLNPDGTQGANLITNGNAVFPQPSHSRTSLRTEVGGSPPPTYFWSGIQSIYTAPADSADITGWAYYNVNVDSETNWNSYLSNCGQWMSTSTPSPQSKGSVGLNGNSSFANAHVVEGIWGNYYYQLDSPPANVAVLSTWTVANSFLCTQHHPIVCAH